MGLIILANNLRKRELFNCIRGTIRLGGRLYLWILGKPYNLAGIESAGSIYQCSYSPKYHSSLIWLNRDANGIFREPVGSLPNGTNFEASLEICSKICV